MILVKKFLFLIWNKIFLIKYESDINGFVYVYGYFNCGFYAKMPCTFLDYKKQWKNLKNKHF